MSVTPVTIDNLPTLTINALATYSGSFDATNDFFVVYENATTSTVRVSRDTALGISSQPLGLTDTQSPTNKTFDNTNAFTIKDGSLTLQNSSSTTKQATFSLSGITAGQTRVMSIPDYNGTIATLAGTETLTNKTLTAPTITNATLSSDTITGYTSSHSGTIYGITVSTGTIGSAALASGAVTSSALASNAVTSTAVAAGAIQPQALTSGTGSTWAWSSWTPTYTNITVGNGATTFAKYIQIGKTINFRIKFTLGSSSAVSGAINFSPPVAPNTDYTSTTDFFFIFGSMVQPGTTNVECVGWFTDSTHILLRPMAANGTYANAVSDTSSTVPFTWATGNYFVIQGSYEAA